MRASVPARHHTRLCSTSRSLLRASSSARAALRGSPDLFRPAELHVRAPLGLHCPGSGGPSARRRAGRTAPAPAVEDAAAGTATLDGPPAARGSHADLLDLEHPEKRPDARQRDLQRALATFTQGAKKQARFGRQQRPRGPGAGAPGRNRAAKSPARAASPEPAPAARVSPGPSRPERMSAPDRLGRNRSYRATMDRDDAHGNGGASVATGARTAAGARTTAPAAGRRSAATTASKVVVGSKAGAAASNARLLSNQAAMNVSRKKITATLPTSTHTTAVDDLMDLDRPGSKQRAGAARASVTRGPVQRAAASTTRLNVTRPQHADALDVLLAAEKAASTAAGAVAAQPSPLPSPAPSRTNSLVSALPDAINGKDPGGVAAADAAEELADAARVGPSGVAVPVAITGVHRVRGGRPYMEDRHTVVEGLSSVTSAMLTRQGQQEPSRTYVAVFDGHNGADCAEIAARDVHRYLSCHAGFNMEPPSPEVDFRAAEAAAQRAPESPYHRDGKVAAFKDAFRQVDEDIIQKCNSGVARGGSTALALLRENNLLYAAHAGDSRAVLGRNGKALRLTVDHKPNLPRERRRIVDNGGMVELVGCWRVIIATPGEGRVLSGLAVSRSLGDVEFKQPTKLVTEEPDVSRLRLTPNDNMVIAASDGLWDVMSDQDAVELATRTVRGWLRQRDRSSPAASPSQRGLVRRTSRSGQSPSALSSTAARLGLSRSSSKVLSPGSEPSTPKTGPGWGAERVPQAAAEAAAKALCERALREGSMDNITCVVMLLQWP